MVGRADVARLAGVTPAVVSYVVNNNHPVADGTRRRVLAAIDQLGYRPNALARALAMNRTHTIGLLVPDSANPFFAELAGAIENAAHESGLIVLLGNTFDDREREHEYVRTFLDRQVDGLIVCPATLGAHLMPEISKAGVPVVFTDRAPGMPDVDHVAVDNVGGARVATEHLISHGRTCVACVTGPADAAPAVERVEGWREALTAAGLVARDDLCVFTDFTSFDGYHQTARLLEAEPAIDALLVGSDQQAIGALRAIRDAGKHAGKDVSVASFDGIRAGAFTVPSLTTVAQPFQSAASSALQLLSELIEHPKDRAHKGASRILPTRLVIRESCGCPPLGGPPPDTEDWHHSSTLTEGVE